MIVRLLLPMRHLQRIPEHVPIQILATVNTRIQHVIRRVHPVRDVRLGNVPVLVIVAVARAH